jgi:hypothetical protein
MGSLFLSEEVCDDMISKSEEELLNYGAARHPIPWTPGHASTP